MGSYRQVGSPTLSLISYPVQFVGTATRHCNPPLFLVCLIVCEMMYKAGRLEQVPFMYLHITRSPVVTARTPGVV